MLQLKNWIRAHNVKRVGITSFGRNVTTNVNRVTNAAAFDIIYMEKFLTEECGIQTDIIRGNKEHDTFASYDLLIVQPCSYVMFGGAWDGWALDFIYDYVQTFSGTTMCIYNDPNIVWANPLKVLSDRNRVRRGGPDVVADEFDPTFIDMFETKKLVGLFIGRNWNAFKEHAKPAKHVIWPNEIVTIKLSEYIFDNEFADCIVRAADPTTKPYDVVYYGSNRKNKRNKLLNSIFKKNESLNLRWIGYDPGYPNTTWSKKVAHGKLGPCIEECLTSIVAGDPAHNDNIVIYRFYEALQFNVVNLITRVFDPEMYLYQDDLLRKLCYVDSLKDIEVVIDVLRNNDGIYEEVLQRQEHEIRRIMHSWKGAEE